MKPSETVTVSAEYIRKMQEQIKVANHLIVSFDGLVESLIGKTFRDVMDYYDKYNVDKDSYR